jgi:hypothetical protein
MKTILNELAIGCIALGISFILLAAFSTLVKIEQPIKVHTQADPLMLQEACITGYVGTLKSITVDLVVDANVYCSEKYPK